MNYSMTSSRQYYGAAILKNNLETVKYLSKYIVYIVNVNCKVKVPSPCKPANLCSPYTSLNDLTAATDLDVETVSL